MGKAAGGLPVAPLSPLVVAEVGDASTFLSTLTSVVVVLLVGGAWLLTRRRRSAATPLAVLALVLLLSAAWLPRPAFAERDHVEGFLTGTARIPVVADPGAPLVVEGGEGSLEDGVPTPWLVLRCPGRCAFRLGAEPAWEGGAAAALPAGDELPVELRGGPLSVKHVQSLCQRLPLLVSWMRGGDPCMPCWTREFLTGGGHEGEVRLRVAPSPVC